MADKLQAGEERGRVLGFIWNLDIQQSEQAELDENVRKRADEIAKEKAGDTNFSDDPKLSVTGIIINDTAHLGIIGVYPGCRYSHVLASREQDFDPSADPIESIYNTRQLGTFFKKFTRKDARFVNALTQGALIAVNPDGRSTKTPDLPVIIAVRKKVDSGRGLRHHIAGYTDLPRGFEGYRFTTSLAFNHMYRELHEEIGIGPSDLVTGLQPLAITQSHLEPQVCYLGITRLGRDEIRERHKNARDKGEGDLEFIPLKELGQYAREKPFYSHSRPLYRDHPENVIERFAWMQGQ